jgi:hypothetical protein
MTTRAVVLGVTAILIGLPLAGWFFFVSHMARDGHADFRATYTAGYLLRTGQPLYDYGTELQAQNQQISVEPIAMPFIHPAYEALIYAPLSFLGYHAAYWIFFGINVLLLRLLCRILAPELSLLSSIAPALPAATLLAFLPIGASLVQGQDSIILLLIFAIVFARFRGSSNLFISGAIFGLGAFRFQLVLPILLCFAIWRRWKFVAGFSLIASACACVSVQLAGFWPYFRTINGLVSGPYIHAFQPIEHMPNLHGLIVAIGGGKQWVVTLSLFVLAFAVVTGIGRNMQQQFSIAITAALLVSYYGLIHDVSILFIPLTFLIGQNKLSIAVIGFLTPVLIIFAPEHFYFAAIGLLGLLWLLCWRVGQFGQGKVGCDKLEVSVSSAT